MPVHTGRDTKGCYAQWGNAGKKYYYACGNKTAMGKAKQKAHIQGYAAGVEAGASDKSWAKVNKSKLPKPPGWTGSMWMSWTATSCPT